MSSNEQQIEQDIAAKGLTAPRVTKQQIDSLMARVSYAIVERPNNTNLVLAIALLDGQFELAIGKAACVSAENYNSEIGIRIATAEAETAARNKLWELEGYALRQRLAADTDTWLGRLKAERVQLGERLQKLSDFLAGVSPNENAEHRGLLEQQYTLMAQLATVLDARLALATKEGHA